MNNKIYRGSIQDAIKMFKDVIDDNMAESLNEDRKTDKFVVGDEDSSYMYHGIDEVLDTVEFRINKNIFPIIIDKAENIVINEAPDLSKKKGTSTNVLTKNDSWKNCTSVNDLYNTVKKLFDENNLHSISNNTLLNKIKSKKNLADALMLVYNSILKGSNLGVTEDIESQYKGIDIQATIDATQAAELQGVRDTRKASEDNMKEKNKETAEFIDDEGNKYVTEKLHLNEDSDEDNLVENNKELWTKYFDGTKESVDKISDILDIDNADFDYAYIPDSVTNIGNDAFSECIRLTSIVIPNSVTRIGQNAFDRCESLTNIKIPDSVTSIGDWAFSDCRDLASVTISSSVTSIGVAIFSGCIGLTSITIPRSVTSIGENAFRWCRSLTDVHYTGTEEDWNNIEIAEGNRNLQNANIHFKSRNTNESCNKRRKKRGLKEMANEKRDMWTEIYDYLARVKYEGKHGKELTAFRQGFVGYDNIYVVNDIDIGISVPKEEDLDYAKRVAEKFNLEYEIKAPTLTHKNYEMIIYIPEEYVNDIE